MNELKLFTLHEANGLIPRLSELLARLHEKRDEINSMEVKIDALELITEHAHRAEELNDLTQAHQVLAAEFYHLVDEIHACGCFLKDLDIGLVDFYGVVDGEVVYLCWRLGETQVCHWHEVGKGFANRHPLNEG